MVQRVVYRRRHSYCTKSNAAKVVKTPGAKLVLHRAKKRTPGPRCGVTKRPILGRSVTRPYGKTISGRSLRERIIRAFLAEEKKVVAKVLKLVAARSASANEETKSIAAEPLIHEHDEPNGVVMQTTAESNEPRVLPSEMWTKVAEHDFLSLISLRCVSRACREAPVLQLKVPDILPNCSVHRVDPCACGCIIPSLRKILEQNKLRVLHIHGNMDTLPGLLLDDGLTVQDQLEDFEIKCQSRYSSLLCRNLFRFLYPARRLRRLKIQSGDPYFFDGWLPRIQQPWYASLTSLVLDQFPSYELLDKCPNLEALQFYDSNCHGYHVDEKQWPIVLPKLRELRLDVKTTYAYGLPEVPGSDLQLGWVQVIALKLKELYLRNYDGGLFVHADNLKKLEIESASPKLKWTVPTNQVHDAHGFVLEVPKSLVTLTYNNEDILNNIQ